MAETRSLWYLAVRGSKWHKAIAIHKGADHILSACSRDILVCAGIERKGSDVPAADKCSSCARNGGAS